MVSRGFFCGWWRLYFYSWCVFYIKWCDVYLKQSKRNKQGCCDARNWILRFGGCFAALNENKSAVWKRSKGQEIVCCQKWETFIFYSCHASVLFLLCILVHGDWKTKQKTTFSLIATRKHQTVRLPSPVTVTCVVDCEGKSQILHQLVSVGLKHVFFFIFNPSLFCMKIFCSHGN